MKRIKAGIIGMGFIGVSHVEAIRRIGFAELVAVADANPALASAKAAEYGIPTCYGTVAELLADPEISVVHNCTPNNQHLEINEKIIRSGKHVFSEKPLGLTSIETRRMLDLLTANPRIVGGVNFNYRMNPLVQDMKNRVRNGDIGAVNLVHGSYLQDWLLYDTDYNWRVEPEVSGLSRCVADIGSHWMDIVQTVTGLRIVEVCADLYIAHPVRKKPKGQVETFSINTSADYEPKKVTTEDYGAVLIRFENGAHGVFHVSQISAGRKCYFNFEIDGSKSSFYWNQETADHMWQGSRDGYNSQIMRNPNLMTPESRPYSYLAAGHPEGWNDAMKNNVYAMYKFIADGKDTKKDKPDFAVFEDGHYITKLVEAILESNAERRWVTIS
ncbi:MAG: Gfo/Idh/MocA family oxidoreductase [Spirochaetota bacterium]